MASGSSVTIGNKSMSRLLVRGRKSDNYFSTRLFVTSCMLKKVECVGDGASDSPGDALSWFLSKLSSIENKILMGRNLSLLESKFIGFLSSGCTNCGFCTTSFIWLILGTVLSSILNINTIIYSILFFSMQMDGGTFLEFPSSNLI